MDDLAALYRARFSEADRARKDAIWKVLCENFFQRYVPPGSTVLDLASGYGEFVRHIRADRKIAIDLNPEAREFLPDGAIALRIIMWSIPFGWLNSVTNYVPLENFRAMVEATFAYGHYPIQA